MTGGSKHDPQIQIIAKKEGLGGGLLRRAGKHRRKENKGNRGGGKNGEIGVTRIKDLEGGCATNRWRETEN